MGVLESGIGIKMKDPDDLYLFGKKKDSFINELMFI